VPQPISGTVRDGSRIRLLSDSQRPLPLPLPMIRRYEISKLDKVTTLRTCVVLIAVLAASCTAAEPTTTTEASTTTSTEADSGIIYRVYFLSAEDRTRCRTAAITNDE
jgi:hypothetical protein